MVHIYRILLQVNSFYSFIQGKLLFYFWDSNRIQMSICSLFHICIFIHIYIDHRVKIQDNIYNLFHKYNHNHICSLQNIHIQLTDNFYSMSSQVHMHNSAHIHTCCCIYSQFIFYCTVNCIISWHNTRSYHYSNTDGCRDNYPGIYYMNLVFLLLQQYMIQEYPLQLDIFFLIISSLDYIFQSIVSIYELRSIGRFHLKYKRDMKTSIIIFSIQEVHGDDNQNTILIRFISLDYTIILYGLIERYEIQHYGTDLMHGDQKKFAFITQLISEHLKV